MMGGGEPDRVLEMRRDFQRMMKERYSEMIEELTGRKVLAFLSQAHVEPDLTIEIFLMDGPLAGFGALSSSTHHRATPARRRLTAARCADGSTGLLTALTRDAFLLTRGDGAPSCCASATATPRSAPRTFGRSPLTGIELGRRRSREVRRLEQVIGRAVVLARLRPALRSRTPRPDAITVLSAAPARSRGSGRARSASPHRRSRAGCCVL